MTKAADTVRTLIAALTACILVTLGAARCNAQAGPITAPLREPIASAPLPPVTPRPVARARLILAPGVATTASALVHLMWAIPVRPCGNAPEPQRLPTNSLYAAAAFGAVGLSLTFTGGFLLSRAKAGAHVPLSRRERAILPLFGIATAVGTQLVLSMVRLGDVHFCSS